MTCFFREQIFRRFLSGAGMFAVALIGVTTPVFAWQAPTTQQPSPTTTPAVPPPTTQSPPSQTPPPQTTPSTPTPAQGTPPTTTPQEPTKPTDPTSNGDDKNRVFGVLPNYTSVSASDKFVPISGKESIKIAALDSVSDPMVYPLYGFVAGVAHVRNDPVEWGGGITGYTKRYGAA